MWIKILVIVELLWLIDLSFKYEKTHKIQGIFIEMNKEYSKILKYLLDKGENNEKDNKKTK